MLLRYAVAVVSIVAALYLRLLLDPLLGIRFPFATVFFAVLLTAWFGGFGPAIAASVLGSLASAWYLLPPQYSFTIGNSQDQAGLTLYAAVSIGIALVGGAMHRARRLAEVDTANVSGQREQLRVTLESIGDAVIATDTRGRITSMNAVAINLTCWPADDAIGRNVDEVFKIVNERTDTPVVSPVEKVLSEGCVVGLANHTVLIARNGDVRPIDDSAAPIRDSDGALIGVVLVFRDVTDRRRAEAQLRRSEQELTDLFENANVGLHFVGADGTVLHVNRAELALLGYDRHEYIGHHIAEFHDDQEAIADILRRLAAGEMLEGYPARMRCKDGSIKEVIINSSVRWDEGRFVHARCFTLDVTQQRRAEEAQALLAAAVESSDDAIVTKTLEGVITSWNAGAEHLFGYSAAEATSQPITMIIPPERHAEERMIIERLRLGERIEHFETVRLHKDGRPIEISLSVSPVRNAYDRIIGATKIARDVTARKRAEERIRESDERFRALAVNAPAAIFIKDLEGRYTHANPLACEALGRPQAVSGLTDHDLLPAPIADDLRRRDLEVIAARRAIESEEVVSRPGYERRFLSVKFPLYGPDGPVGVCGVAIDITERKRAEEALVAEDRRKDAFLATLAHELRNPLAPLRNSIEIMQHAIGDAELLGKAQETMTRQVSHLERLVDDLVDVSRISRDQLELRREQVELGSIMHHAVETCRPLAQVRNLELTVDMASETIYLEADPVRLAQVFSNLLNNSCKYTETNGRIRITARREGNEAVVSIRDTGIGIPTEMLSSIFDMFTQVNRSPEHLPDGLGIGLTLVRRLVEMHGGAIEARSEGPGHGSEFVVRLPAVANPIEQPASTPASSESSSNRLRILVVDDNTDAAESLATLLEMTGHEVHVAHDGVEAFAVAEKVRPNVALLDIGLPKMSGHDVALRIRAEPWGRNVVLVALTGWGQQQDRRRSQEVGFDHHLVKPVDVDRLMRVLSSLEAE